MVCSHPRKRRFIVKPIDSNRLEERFLTLVSKMIFNMGWSRHLVVESIAANPDLSDIIRVRRKKNDFSETDIVGLYAEDDYLLDKISLQLIRADCREFLIRHSVLN